MPTWGYCATVAGMLWRAGDRRQLLLSLRERALRAEAEQELHEEQARVAERTRIAREMHDVLAHRISLLALHAGGLEVRPDLPPAQVQETAALLRTTARQALEELRSVIGVLRENEGTSRCRQSRSRRCETSIASFRRPGAPARTSTTKYTSRVSTTRRLRWDETPTASCSRHSPTPASTPVAPRCGCGSQVPPDVGLRISIRNHQPVPAYTTPTLPGSGALLGCMSESRWRGHSCDRP